ncbi:unnamed protein product [Sphagnum balticum]
MLGRRKAAQANQQYAAANDYGTDGVPAGSLGAGGSNYVQQPQYVDQTGGPLGSNYTGHKTGYAGNGVYAGQNGDPAYAGGAGVPIDGRRRHHRLANCCAAFFACCWCCTWPCHGPCCGGL